MSYLRGWYTVRIKDRDEGFYVEVTPKLWADPVVGENISTCLNKIIVPWLNRRTYQFLIDQGASKEQLTRAGLDTDTTSIVRTDEHD